MTSLSVILLIILQPILFFLIRSREIIALIDIPLACVVAYLVYQRAVPSKVTFGERQIPVNKGIKTALSMGMYVLSAFVICALVLIALAVWILKDWQ